MKILRFVGHSDDTFGEETTGVDHDNCANGEPIDFLVSTILGAVIVSGHYDYRECWAIGIRLAREGAELPAWPMRFEPEHGYSHALDIEAPSDVVVEYLPVKR